MHTLVNELNIGINGRHSLCTKAIQYGIRCQPFEGAIAYGKLPTTP